MRLYYKFSSVKIISAYIPDNIFDGDIPNNFYLDVNELEKGCYNGKFRKCKVLKDSKGAYFAYRGKNIYVQDFIWISVEELIKQLQNKDKTDQFPNLEEKIIATFIKDTENVAISEKTEKGEVFYAPIETPLYQKKDWGYKIPIKEIDTSTRTFKEDANHRALYSCDLANLLEKGYFKLLNKSTISA